MRLRTPLIAALGLALVAGFAYPYVELAWKCREGMAASEACVWGRAYFPMSRWVEPLIVTPVAWLVFLGLARLVSRRARNPDTDLS